MMNYIKDKDGEYEDGEYEVTLFDAGGQKSDSCANFIIDNTAPTCDLSLQQTNENNTVTKKLILTGDDKITAKVDLSKLIATSNNKTKLDV
ncbi:MAG: hypothetical protein ACI31R_02275 [Bacilli bacterium]